MKIKLLQMTNISIFIAWFGLCKTTITAFHAATWNNQKRCTIKHYRIRAPTAPSNFLVGDTTLPVCHTQQIKDSQLKKHYSHWWQIAKCRRVTKKIQQTDCCKCRLRRLNTELSTNLPLKKFERFQIKNNRHFLQNTIRGELELWANLLDIVNSYKDLLWVNQQSDLSYTRSKQLQGRFVGKSTFAHTF